MANENVYLIAIIDQMGHAVKHAVQHNQPNNLAMMRQDIQRGQKIIEAWMEDHGGRVLLASGDEICAELPGANMEDLPKLHSEAQDAYDHSITFGVGLDLKEALKAAQAGQKRGSKRIVFYAPEIEEHLNEESASESHDAKNNDGDPDELKEFGLSKANSPVSGPPSPGQGMSPFGPGSAQPSGADMPPPPSSTNAADGLSSVQDQMRQMASGGEADAARSQAQAQSADNGAGNPEQLKQGMARILMKVKEQLPVLEQLKEQAPEAYKAILGMVQVVASIAKQLAPQGQPEQKEQPKEEPVAKAYITSDDKAHIMRQSTGINHAVNYTLDDEAFDAKKEELEPSKAPPSPGRLAKLRRAAMLKTDWEPTHCETPDCPNKPKPGNFYCPKCDEAYPYPSRPPGHPDDYRDDDMGKKAIPADALEEGSADEEGEHHLGPKLSEKIASDHLKKDPKYYDKMKKDALPMPEKLAHQPQRPSGSLIPRVRGDASPQTHVFFHQTAGQAAHVGMDGQLDGKRVTRQAQSGRVLPNENVAEAATGQQHWVSALNPTDSKSRDEAKADQEAGQ
jgi:hypothetical protein